MKRTDQPPQDTAPHPTLPDVPYLPAQVLLVTAAILNMHPRRILTQDTLDIVFAHAVAALPEQLPAPVADEVRHQAYTHLPEAPAGNEHGEYAAMLKLIAGSI